MDSVEPEENGLEILYAAVVDDDALGLEHAYLLFQGRAFSLPLESTHPTG